MPQAYEEPRGCFLHQTLETFFRCGTDALLAINDQRYCICLVE